MDKEALEERWGHELSQLPDRRRPRTSRTRQFTPRKTAGLYASNGAANASGPETAATKAKPASE